MSESLAHLLDLHRLRTLLVFAECGSLSETASRLYLTPAAVHKQLQVLGRELDVHLYEREGRELRLTHAAEYVLPHVRNLLAQQDAVLTAVEEWRGLDQRTVRIGTGRTFSSYLLPSILQAFRARNPKVEIYVQTGHTPDLIYRELEREPFLLYPEGSLFAVAIERYLQDSGLKPNVTMRLDNPESIKAMARAGLGLAMLPLWTVADELREGSLKLVEREVPPLRSRMELITRCRSHAPQTVAGLIDLARAWSWKDHCIVQQ